MSREEKLYLVMNYVKKHTNQTLEQLKYRLHVYEADINLACDNEECKGCNDNVFKSIYRFIDDLKED